LKKIRDIITKQHGGPERKKFDRIATLVQPKAHEGQPEHGSRGKDLPGEATSLRPQNPSSKTANVSKKLR